MFYHLILENESADRIDMTTTANQYMTSKVEGLSPPPCTISTSSYAGMDGSYLNNAFIEKRNVVIHFEMRSPLTTHITEEVQKRYALRVAEWGRYAQLQWLCRSVAVLQQRLR